MAPSSLDISKLLEYLELGVKFVGEFRQRRMDLRKGKKVEACSSEEGYGGAWFEGVIVAGCRGHGQCKIQYDKFVADDGKPLVEKVWASEVRPIPPPRRLPLRCSIRDTVEAYDTDCWWRGVIVKLEVKICLVYFPDTGTIKAYGRSFLRPAQEWIEGKWRLVPQARDPRVEQVIRAALNSGEANSTVTGRCSEMSGRQIQRVHEGWHSNHCTHEGRVPKQEVSGETEEELQNCRSGESGHKTQLMAYRNLLQAFHVDRCSLTQERRNLLNAIRMELHICEHEHNLAMEEMASLLRIWGSPLPFWF